MDSVNPEFALSDSKNECIRTLYLRLALVRWPFNSSSNALLTMYVS